LQSLLKSSSEQYESELANAKQHIQGLESALTEKEQQLQVEREKFIELECENKTLNEDLRLAEQANQSVESLQEDSETLEQQKKLLLTELDDRGTLLASLQIETRRLSDNLKHQRDENHSLLKGNAMLQSRAQQMSEKFDAMSDKLQSREREIEDKQQHIDILQKKLRLAEQNIEHLKSQQNV
jgi:chromosome segregation ATPase